MAMTVTQLARLDDFASKHADAAAPLTAWLQTVRAATWQTPVDAVETWNSSDPNVKMPSGQKVAIFNIKGNKYRLVASINYRSGIVNVLRIMTHAEYSKDKWKASL